MQGARLLVQMELIDRVRRGFVAKLLPKSRLGLRHAFALKAFGFGLFALVFYVLPILLVPVLTRTPDGIQPGPLPVTTVNLGSGLFVLFGLFVGAYLVCDQTVAENGLLLSYPITIRDLVGYRLLEACFAALKTGYYLLLPAILLQLLLAHWPPGVAMQIVILCLLFLLFLYLNGAALMLLLCRVFFRTAPDKLFLFLLLGLAWLVALGLQLKEVAFLGVLFTPLLKVIAGIGDFALPALLVRITASSLPKALLLCGFAFSLLPALWALLMAIDGMLAATYLGVHRGERNTEAKVLCKSTSRNSDRTRRLGYVHLSQMMRLLPLTARAMVAKDLLFFWRRPNALLRVVVVVVVLLFGTRYTHGILIHPLVFVMYFLPAFLIFRIFVDTIGIETANVHIIWSTFPRWSGYLKSRARIALGAGVVLGTVILGMFGAMIPWWGWLHSGARIAFVVLNVLVAALLVTAYSASFSSLQRKSWGDFEYSIHPVAVAMYPAVGLPGPALFYCLDLVTMGGESKVSLLPWIGGLVVFLVISNLVLWFLGVNMVRRRLAGVVK